ncbi:MFS transporter [Thermodesulfobacteriota bacterium]
MNQITGWVKRYTTVIRENRTILIICAATAISMTGFGIISPVLPLFAREFGVGNAAIGFVVGIYGLSRLCINLPAGILGERLGRKNLMWVGLAINGVCLYMTGRSQSIGDMAVWRFMSGGGAAMYMTGAMSYIADISTSENRGRMMSLQLGSLLLGTDIGPIIGGFVADRMGFRWPFYLAAIFACLASMWVLTHLKESRRDINKPSSTDSQPTSRKPIIDLDFQTMGRLLTNPTFLFVSCFTLLVFFTRTGSRQTLLPLLAVEQAGMSATKIGVLFTFMTAINLLLVLPVGSLTDRLGRKAVILPGVILSLAGLSIFSWSANIPLFFVGAFITGLGTGMIGPAPAAYIMDLAPPGKTGITVGLYRSFGDLGAILGPLLLGYIADLFHDKFTAIPGQGVAMEFNAVMLVVFGLLLLTFGKETAGKNQTDAAS